MGIITRSSCYQTYYIILCVCGSRQAVTNCVGRGIPTGAEHCTNCSSRQFGDRGPLESSFTPLRLFTCHGVRTEEPTYNNTDALSDQLHRHPLQNIV